MRPLACSALIFALLLRAPAAAADPQGHVALRTALCGAGDERGVWRQTRWCNGVTGDLLFFRERNRDWGFGPYLEVSTAGFWDARWGGGGTLLIPVTENLPLLLSLGAYGHELHSAALGVNLFFGARSYNFDGVYNWAIGVYASGYRDLTNEHSSLLSVGLEIDGFFVVAPLLLGIGALR